MEEKKLLPVAIMYDFDETLSPNYMQEYGLLPRLNTDANLFFSDCEKFGQENNMDSILAYMFKILEYAKRAGVDITYHDLVTQGKVIEFFDGVETYFDAINRYGESIGLKVEHYIISSGLKELIEGSKIAHHFKRIFACTFAYDKNSVAFWPAQVVNYTTKTQYLFRIKKDKLDNLYNQREVNEYVADKERLLAYKRMIYLGDGFTDIPCMKVVKDKGGTSICVYNPVKQKAKMEAEKIFADTRVNFIAPADYRENSQLFSLLKDVLMRISIDDKLSQYKNDTH